MSECFRRDADIDQIDVGNGFVVGLKRKMSYKDHQKFSTLLIGSGGEIITEEGTGQKRVIPNADGIEESDVMLMLMNIKEWNLTDDDGQIAPIDREHIDELDPDIGDIVSKEILRRNPFLGK